jgi:polar amino acid transport system permease protein
MARGARDVLQLGGVQDVLPGRAQGLLARRQALRDRRDRRAGLRPGHRAHPAVDAAGARPAALLGAIFVDLFRGIPTILVVYLVGFGLPALELSGLPTNPVVLGGIGLLLSYSAYVAEVYRSGIASIHPSQLQGALAVGLTPNQATRHVILPQAVRRVIPPLLNDFISLQKDVALVSILGPLEAFRVAQIEASSNFNYTPLLAAAALYLLVTIPLARVLDRLERRRAAR